jgi:hypothetical protein
VVNDDITHLRLAETTDGINFTDKGILQGLNDPGSVSLTGTRWLATAGTILKLEGGPVWPAVFWRRVRGW